jgi:hypothetical protein
MDDMGEEEEDDEEDYDDAFFSPASSDIESDLDLLDQSGHEFHDADNRRRSGSFFYGGGSTRNGNNSIRQKMMDDDDFLSTAVGGGGGGGTASAGRSVEERDVFDGVRVDDIMNEDEDYLHDDDDDANITMGGEEDEKIDMSGL